MRSDFLEYRLVGQFVDFEKNRDNEEQLKYLNFDLLLANPPFAGEIKEKSLLAEYTLGRNSKGKLQNKVERHLLFIERNLDYVKPGGRLAVVLPQGVFNNTNMDYIRSYMIQRARVLAVVGLHINSFKPHTGTKTSVIFLQKWSNDDFDENGKLKVEDYPIFFASQKQSFKNNSGDYIIEKDRDGLSVKDEDGNARYLSDLDEITDAFLKWGKEQTLDFIG
jgi:type I restriction enzyme M protein